MQASTNVSEASTVASASTSASQPQPAPEILSSEESVSQVQVSNKQEVSPAPVVQTESLKHVKKNTSEDKNDCHQDAHQSPRAKRHESPRAKRHESPRRKKTDKQTDKKKDDLNSVQSTLSYPDKQAFSKMKKCFIPG